MTAYVIFDETVHDPAGMRAYQQLAMPTLGQYGGRVVIAAPEAEVAEGTWCPKMLVVLAFDSMEQAKRWYASPEYTAARSLRQQAATTNVVFAPGL